jgi:hypothetical protein
MRTRIRRYWSLALVLPMALAPLVSGASNLSFLDKSTVSNFKEQDVKLLMETADKALDSNDPRAGGSWSNPKTGNSGDVAVTGQFTSSDGHLCKRLKVLNRAKTMESSAQYVLCQVPGRGWLLNPEARPAPPDAAAPAK